MRSTLRTTTAALAFLAIAGLCSIPRFGQRENDRLPGVSDSDYYIDMARVFTGKAAAFKPEWVKHSPHHYNRPLLSFLAGHTSDTFLHGNLRAAFSVVQVISATVLAVLLLELIRRNKPHWKYPWLPSVLFLSGFPQLDWGYHILSDGIGMATAFAVTWYAANLIGRSGEKLKVLPWTLHLLALWACSAVAFLTRETGWFAVVTCAYLVSRRRKDFPQGLLPCALVLLVLLLGTIPHTVYADHFHVSGVPLKLSAASLLNPYYMLDFLMKTGVCFNLAWLLAARAFWQQRGRGTPDFVIGWTIAAVLYIGAGYVANNFQSIGYPLRMSYALFPFVFYWATFPFEEPIAIAARWSGVACFIYLALQTSINLVGVLLDPAHGKITVTDVFSALRDRLVQ